MRRRRSSAARMSDVTGTRKRVRHQGTRTGEQLTISLADATRCEAWEFMNNASGLSLSNDTSAVTLFTKVKRAETTWRYDREDSMWDKLLSYRVTFFRLHFFFCYTQCPLLSRQIAHIEPIFKALFVYSVFPAAPDGVPKQTKPPWAASEAGNDTGAAALCARFSGKMERAKRVKRWTFPTGVETNSPTRERRVKWLSGVLLDIFCACIMHSPQDMSPASSKQPVAV